MTAFETIREAAAGRLGGDQALQERLPNPEPPEGLAMVGDDRYLSVMSRRIFRAGLQHRMVDARWPAFEAAFADFDLATVAAMDDADIRRLSGDESLIRHPRKLTAVRDNAIATQAVVAEHGSFGAWLAGWPEDEIVELWFELQSRFSQLGGNSAPAFLRMTGKDTFLITDWVGAALRHWDAWDGSSKGKRAQRGIQAVFNNWMEASDWPLCGISQTLALSIDHKAD